MFLPLVKGLNPKSSLILFRYGFCVHCGFSKTCVCGNKMLTMSYNLISFLSAKKDKLKDNIEIKDQYSFKQKNLRQ